MLGVSRVAIAQSKEVLAQVKTLSTHVRVIFRTTSKVLAKPRIALLKLHFNMWKHHLVHVEGVVACPITIHDC